jgi:hypothetical protein
LVAPIRHRIRQPLTDPKLPLGLTQQQETSIRGLVATVEINCEFLAMNGWQIKGEQRRFCHDGCGAA